MIDFTLTEILTGLDLSEDLADPESMVERVAKALFVAEQPEGQPFNEFRWQHTAANYRLLARVGIAAIREPTDGMILSGAKASADQHDYKTDFWSRSGYLDDDVKRDFLNGAKFGFYAMIDEALK